MGKDNLRPWTTCLLFAASILLLGLAFALGNASVSRPEIYPPYTDTLNDSATQGAVQRDFRPCIDHAETVAQSELCAQYRAATSSSNAAYWALLQLGASVLGIIGLALTISLTFRATKAALESNEISFDTSRRELRAYLSIREAKIEVRVGRRPIIFLEVMNYGRTQAFKYAPRALMIIGGPRDQYTLPPMPADDRPELTVHPKEAMPLSVTGPAVLTQADFDAIKVGTKVIYILADVHYFDAFDAARVTTFSKEFSGSACVKTRACRFSTDGNTAT